MKKKTIEEVHLPHGLQNQEIKYKKIKQPYTPPDLFKIHSLIAFVGSRGSGKTHALVNLAKQYLEEGSFTRTFVISPTYESNPIFHHLGIENSDVYTNTQNAIEAIEDILQKTKQDSEDYHHYEEYMVAYRKYKRKIPMTLEEQTMLENNNFERPNETIPRPSHLLIIDDMSHSDLYSTSRRNPFINLCLRHRHINGGKGITIMMCVQNFRSGLPLALRQNIQVYFIWSTHDSGQLDAIYREVANLVDEETFYSLYRIATKEPHHFLTIDTAAKPGKQFRKNFDILLNPKTNHLEI